MTKGKMLKGEGVTRQKTLLYFELLCVIERVKQFPLHFLKRHTVNFTGCVACACTFLRKY